MTYEPPKYPTAIPDLEDLPDRTDDVDWVNAARLNELKKELRAIMIELGTLPKGSSADVKTRLDSLTPQFHDRGDPIAFDFFKENLITDQTWRDLDLSSIVPAGAVAVVLHLRVVDDAVSSYIDFRKKGNTSSFNVGSIRTQGINVYYEPDLIIPCNVDRVIQYYAKDTTWTAINIVVKGWFK